MELAEWSAAVVIGERIIEMADRLRTTDKVVPGTTAQTCFTLDDLEFEVTLKVTRPTP